MVYRSDVADCPAEASKQELVLPGKRWEATREGVEDYVYLWMLRDAIRNANRTVSAESLARARRVLTQSPTMVLDDVDDTRLADRAKADILKAIIDVSRGQER